MKIEERYYFHFVAWKTEIWEGYLRLPRQHIQCHSADKMTQENKSRFAKTKPKLYPLQNGKGRKEFELCGRPIARVARSPEFQFMPVILTYLLTVFLYIQKYSMKNNKLYGHTIQLSFLNLTSSNVLYGHPRGCFCFHLLLTNHRKLRGVKQRPSYYVHRCVGQECGQGLTVLACLCCLLSGTQLGLEPLGNVFIPAWAEMVGRLGFQV